MRRYAGAAIIVCVVAALTVLVLYRYNAAPVAVEAELREMATVVTPAQALTWPSYGQASVATAAHGVLATHGATTPQPTASTAKLITALAVMRERPFDNGVGEMLTFTQADVDSYQQYVAGNGTVTPVAVGLEWSQYQALEAILLDSANNVSDTVAVWAFGSLEAYREYAQQMVRGLGMSDTVIGVDASGYSAMTVSTAHDLALLATEVLKQPMLRSIMRQSDTILPGVGQIQNTNTLLQYGEIIGMKTGWTPEAGGVFVLAGEHQIAGEVQEIITVVMGAPGGASGEAQRAAYALFQSAKRNFSYQTILAKDQVVGVYRSAWQDDIEIKAADELGVVVWGGVPLPVQLEVDALRPGAGGGVGSAVAGRGSSEVSSALRVDRPLEDPGVWWRIIERGAIVVIQ